MTPIPRTRSGRRLTFAAAFLALAGAAAPAYAWHYMTPDFLAKTARPMTLAVLPPHADFIKQQAIMTADLLKEAQALEDGVADALGVHLRALGYTVRVVTPGELVERPDLGALVAALNTRYDEEWEKILRKRSQVKSGRYSAGDDVAKVSALLNVEGLILTRVVAIGNSGGRQTLSLILSLGTDYAQTLARISLGVLEGKTGRVQGYFEGERGCTLHGLLKKPAKVMNHLVKVTLNPYPGSNDIKSVEDDAAAGRPKDERARKSDEEAIADFETVLKGKTSSAPAGTPATPEPSPAAPTPTPAPGAP